MLLGTYYSQNYAGIIYQGLMAKHRYFALSSAILLHAVPDLGGSETNSASWNGLSGRVRGYLQTIYDVW